MSQPPAAASGHLVRNMVLFGRLLRRAGLNVGSSQLIDLVEALQYVDIDNRTDFKNSARAIFINRREQRALFDRAFDLFWQSRDKSVPSQIWPNLFTAELPDDSAEPAGSGSTRPNMRWGDDRFVPDESESVGDRAQSYSARETLRHKDFANLTRQELAQVKQMMRTMSWQLEQRPTRRKAPASRGALLDMRRTLRQNLRFGGEPLQLAWQRPRLKRRPLVIICDISGSMERYARILLEFIYVISNGMENVEAFLFSTRLTRITRQIKQRNVGRALDQAVSSIHDWGGGTRIGQALKTFNFNWGRRVLGRGAIALIISDGWDRGDMALLETEMKRLQLSCHRLIWLNPHLGSDNYQPLVRGIQTALPYVDDFLPVHNLRALEQLGDLLQQLGEDKPSRRQHMSINRR